jgi:hypothetical protein
VTEGAGATGRSGHPLRIVIAGQPKTGTTALYFRIKNSVPPDAWCIFEPKKYLQPPDGTRPEWVVAKVLIGRAYARGGQVRADGFTVDHDSFASFHRKLHILRDPRDNLVSSFLYAVRHTSFYADDRRLDQFLAVLEEKERNPTGVSMRRLLDTMSTLDRGVELLPSFLQRQELVGRFLVLYPEYHRVSYAAFVEGDVGDLEDYLGFPLSGSGRVDSHTRVIRTRGHGDWKNWFTADDVTYFRPLLEEYVRLAGLPDDDWELATRPTIPPEFASDYVRRIAYEKRQKDRGRWARRIRALPQRARTWGSEQRRRLTR